MDTILTNIIDGKQLATEIKQQIRTEVINEFLAYDRPAPTLAVILVGEDPASEIYVRNKQRACEVCAINSIVHRMKANTGEDNVIKTIKMLNSDPEISGILVQLPLPKGYNEKRVLEAISPDKDVDALTPTNQAKLLDGSYLVAPCTPTGIMEMLKSKKINLDGKVAVVVGRSKLVGRPIELMLNSANATTILCHSHTKNLKELTALADILVVAVGKPKLIDASYVKTGAVVIDVGINRGSDGKLCGDVDYQSVQAKASLITPVPGGVGPMTIAMLLQNTLKLAKSKI